MSTENLNTENNKPATFNSNEETKPNDSVPLASFLEQKKLTKEMKEKLAGYEAKELKEAEAKLLEEKGYQELIQSKSDKIAALEAESEKTTKNFKLKDVQNKFARALDKNNAINSDDVLKLVDVSDLLDSDGAEAEINKRVESLVKDKSYLFGTKPNTRNSEENNTPHAGDRQINKSFKKVNLAEAALNNAFKLNK